MNFLQNARRDAITQALMRIANPPPGAAIPSMARRPPMQAQVRSLAQRLPAAPQAAMGQMMGQGQDFPIMRPAMGAAPQAPPQMAPQQAPEMPMQAAPQMSGGLPSDTAQYPT